MNYYAKPAMQDWKELDNYEMSCEVQWALYRPNYNKYARIKYKHSMVQIQRQNYALVLTTLSVNYMQVQDYILLQMEELQEHYVRVAPSVHHESMED